MRAREDIEWQWERELGQEVEIMPRGWVDNPTDFALFLDSTFIVAFKHLHEIENYLERYFLVNGE